VHSNLPRSMPLFGIGCCSARAARAGTAGPCLYKGLRALCHYWTEIQVESQVDSPLLGANLYVVITALHKLEV
jgi:hypothetical protein